MAAFPRPSTPIESLHDERIQEVMSQDYDVDTDLGYDDDMYQTARSISHGDDEKARKIYQELRRTIDGLHVIDNSNADLDQAKAMIDSFIYLERLRIETILHPDKPPLSPEGE